MRRSGAANPPLSRIKDMTMTHPSPHQPLIEAAFEHRTAITPKSIDPELRAALDETIDALDRGVLRVSQKIDGPEPGGRWVVNQWLKKAVLLYFRAYDNRLIAGAYTHFFDKVPSKYADWDEAALRASGTRVVPDAVVRKGAFVAKDVVLMPSFVNIGAYIGEGTMVDTWATVGSCAQIGRHCHLSGGAGIGGVLEPLQASPTIIEDHCFIGARSEVVEGFVVGHHSVIGMGVFLGQSTRVYNRATGEVSYGSVPPGSVVVSGQLPAADGSHSLYCAVIVKQVDEKTRGKTSINELLRGLAE
ncbi:MAG: 2,3,4,5-tetrahydropyridine-2,6-dicarboxylate N-succinyltransferase [Rhodobacteraceae bacterium]|nr:2,3,4,5-tetrahydropyridine-2,6-dicarboxylate N-succinyltransferase [Paracoccaceae bacterium]